MKEEVVAVLKMIETESIGLGKAASFWFGG